MGKLTDTRIRTWIKSGHPTAMSDGGGLPFTLSPKGTAAWVVRYRFAGKPREITLGRYPDITLAKARERATEARAKIQHGEDVAREKRKTKLATAAARSFHQLATDYMEKAFPGLAASTVRQRRQHIEGVILPRLGGLAAREVTTADVVALIEAVGRRSQSVAELVFTATSEIFKHGIARHVLTGNPCGVISVSAIVGKAGPKRQRLKLTGEELREILAALPSIGEQNALAVKILLATCSRTGELARAKWANVDFEHGEWLIPHANSKNGIGFAVPMSLAVSGWFKQLQQFACGSPFVLPARQRRRNNYGGEIHYEPRALNAMLHKLCARLGDKVRRFSPHDLRSTARSHLAALGVNVIVAERCLNHSLGGLVAVYDQHDYMTERRAALDLWAKYILACEAGNDWNVMPFRKEAA